MNHSNFWGVLTRVCERCSDRYKRVACKGEGRLFTSLSSYIMNRPQDCYIKVTTRTRFECARFLENCQLIKIGFFAISIVDQPSCALNLKSVKKIKFWSNKRADVLPCCQITMLKEGNLGLSKNYFFPSFQVRFAWPCIGITSHFQFKFLQPWALHLQIW